MNNLTIGALALDWTRERLQRVSLEGLLQFAPNSLIELNKTKEIDLINYMLLKFFYTGETEIHLNATRLKLKYGRNYLTIVQSLIDLNYIELKTLWSTRGKSKLFNLKPNSFINIRRYVQKDPSLLRAWRRHHEEEIVTAVEGSNNKELDFLIRDLYLVRVDHEGALKDIEEAKSIGFQDERSYLKGLASILKLREGDIFHQFDKYGRFHSNLTTISKVTRNNFITINGEPICELDIKCCQPHLLSILIGEKLETPFKEALINDCFYETFAHAGGWTRKESKKKLYEVLFGRISGADQVFAKIWPHTFSWIVEYKKTVGTYKALAWALQKAESDLMFNKIIPEIRKMDSEIPLFTVHDSVCIPQSKQELIKPIFDKIVSQNLPYYKVKVFEK